ncbi:Cytochrome b6-f complex iron-sulfur subunit [Maioricimonas rarisocia]|uniref:Cytochrome b6-f complex iron-sulfur subunit n=1 Tax=Maioricimonas rarisocia TaxID=2528026 RepID=A0A517Z9W8_9PLAN|nr:Rieske 2Fe-2S domain-containing protein [Maioricimonas rarisocia]QDU39284.1 Cytochrome b6-f complex iron-sulfur subunit [Maioricimonas rarisocia]
MNSDAPAMAEESPPASNPPHHDLPRRHFVLHVLTLAISSIVALVPLVTGLIFVLDPLLRKKKSSGGEFVRVTSTSAIPPNGTPMAFIIRADKQDAWNKFPNSELGSVYLMKNEADEIVCFNARCPHLGCTVDYKSGKDSFVCPCHDSAFKLDGTRTNAIPPRDMDTLEVEVRDDTEVWVRFENFAAGTHDKKPV